MQNQQPSIVEALARAHKALSEDLQGLEAPGPAAEMAARLERAQTHLAEHFRFEEQNGYMDGVLKVRPQAERAVRELLQEHRDLARGLGTLLATAKAGRAEPESLAEQVREWVKAVRRHEADETRLVEETFNQDLAAED
jgi:hypothetical protein